jgi:hypothetical protein
MSETAESAPPAQVALTDATASDWLRESLKSALERDPVDALNDALALAGILENHLRTVVQLDIE